MIDSICAFAGLLRKNGVRVSLSELIDAARACEALGLERVDDLRAALSATLVKKPSDQRAFDELFPLFFLRGGAFAQRLEGTPLVELLRGELGLGEEDIERILAALATEAASLGAVARTLLGLRGVDVGPLVRMAGMAAEGMRITSPLMVGYYTHRMLASLSVPDAERELSRLIRLLSEELGEEAAAALERVVERNLASLRQAVRRYVEEEFRRQNLDFFEEFRSGVLSRKPLAQLSPEEVTQLRREVRRLARKLRTQASLRRRVVRRGRLDLRRTFRRSLRAGGVPFDLVHRRRRVEKPRLVVLCDVSDSVRNVSRFMLELVYTLQEQFEKVRSFVFVSDLGETTDLFRRHEIDRAVELAYGGAVINVYANSNYGRALEIFAARHADAVTSKTIVIVIGDARNNYHPTSADRLAEIRRRARRLLWLNPEPPGAWGFGDSAMREFEPHCDRVIVAHNLESLKKVVDQLLL